MINFNSIKNIPLYAQIIISMVLGVMLGTFVGKEYTFVFYPLGDLFIKALKMIIIPLIFTSVTLGVLNLKSGGKVGKIIIKAFVLFSITSMLAICISLLFSNLIRPGTGIDLSHISGGGSPDSVSRFNQGGKSIYELIVNLFSSFIPSNIFQASASNKNALAIIFISIITGLAVGTLKSQKRFDSFKSGIETINEIVLSITNYVIMLAPIGIFGLVVKASSEAGIELFKALSMYALTLSIGITVHMFILLPLLLFVFTGINPIKHFKANFPTILMAFSTSSSGATLPYTMKNLKERVGVSERISSFIPPLGATINMDGTSLYECLAVLFIAQVLGLDLSMAEQIMVVLTAFFAGMGTAAVPSAGFVMIFIVLAAVGLDSHPQVGFIVGSLLAIDRPLDMYRTSANVYSDTVITTIVAKSEKETLKL